MKIIEVAGHLDLQAVGDPVPFSENDERILDALICVFCGDQFDPNDLQDDQETIQFCADFGMPLTETDKAIIEGTICTLCAINGQKV